MRHGCLVCLLAAVVACDRGAPAAPDGPGLPPTDTADVAEPLVVVTINLRCLIDDWDARLPLLVEGLVAAAPDVIGVQEVCAQPGGRDALEELAAALAARDGGELASTRTVTHRAWDAYDEGLAILSRHPIAAVEIVPLPGGVIPRKLLAARVLAPGGPRVLAVTHLDHQSAAARAGQAQTAATALTGFADGAPAVLVGDLNEAPGGGVSGALAAAGLADAWAALHPGDAGFTFPASAPDVRIDYVWTSGDAVRPATIERVLTTPAGAIYASDHLGLRATLAP
jgi:endonuclease/exonuclease/phosphatase family metal-dependent hydrolase